LDGLGLQKLLKSEAAVLAAVAGLPVTAEGGQWVELGAVEVYLPVRNRRAIAMACSASPKTAPLRP